MQVVFLRWCVSKADRVPISINPKEVASTEEVQPVYTLPNGKVCPAATKVTFKGKREVWVVGTVMEVTNRLNAAEVQK